MSAPSSVCAARARDEGGFVLLLVLFVVATLTVTVSGALLVTQSDFMTAHAGVGATRAFHLAQAGLNRYMGAYLTPPTDSVVYSMGGGRVVVRAAKVAQNGSRHTWEISSSATLSSTGRSVERRTVRQLAVVEAGQSGFSPIAPLATATRNVRLTGTYTGADQAAVGSCPAATGSTLAGLAAVAGGYIDVYSATVTGTPQVVTEADTGAMRRRINANWPEMVNPATTFDYEVPTVAWPNFSTIPADVYPRIRVRGPFTADMNRKGRGLLVIDGVLTLKTGFTWEGVILAGDLQYPTTTNAVISGALVIGLNQTATTSVDLRATGTGPARITYQSCHVAAAMPAGPSTFTLLPNTWSEPGTP